MKLIAAMSGGVDSAVAAARAVEAGHEVIGVHLALGMLTHRSIVRVPADAAQSKIHMMPARAADVIGIPFYIWDMAEEFHDGVVEDFLS
jgi:tRNA-uridine 2-sulfurtransferase